MFSENALGHAASSRLSFDLVQFAWVVEVLGIVLGVANSVSITFPHDLPVSIGGWLPVLPVAALACFELLRIPLARAFQQKSRLWPRLIALVALLSLIGIAFENWTFGLERTVNQRLAPVEPLRESLRQTQDAISKLLADEANRQAHLNDDRAALQQKVQDAQHHLEAIGNQLLAEDNDHKSNQSAIVSRCMKIAETCIKPQSDAEMRRHVKATDQLISERAQLAADLDNANKALQSLSTQGLTETNRKLEEFRSAEARASKELAAEVRDNPIYRLTSAFYEIPPELVTDEQLASARKFFSMFGAAIVSIGGTAAALVHYWPESSAGKPSPMSKLANSIRAFVARRRKKVVRIERVEVDKIVEKTVEKIVPQVEIPVLIKETVIKWLPYTGQGALPPEEKTTEQIKGHPAEAALAAARANNASHLRVYK